MRGAAASLILALVAAGVTQTQQQGYSSKYGSINVDAILQNPRVVKSYVNCFLDKGPCTPQGREGKKLFLEVYRSNCSKCSEEQKVLLKKTIKAFYAKRKDDWDKIVEKYDPEDKYSKSFMEWVMSSETV